MAPATPQEFSRTGPLVPAAPAVPPPATKGNRARQWLATTTLTEASLPTGRSARDLSAFQLHTSMFASRKEESVDPEMSKKRYRINVRLIEMKMCRII